MYLKWFESIANTRYFYSRVNHGKGYFILLGSHVDSVFSFNVFYRFTSGHVSKQIVI